MPSNETPKDQKSQTAAPAPAEAAAQTAKELAAVEERTAAENAAKVATMQEVPEPPKLVTALAGGRDSLQEAMRKHNERRAALTKSYTPPPPTDRQNDLRKAEMEAGRKALEKHAASVAAALPKRKDPNEGTHVEVPRPGSHVPKFGSPDPGGAIK
jgi:hypothetical protein